MLCISVRCKTKIRRPAGKVCSNAAPDRKFTVPILDLEKPEVIKVPQEKWSAPMSKKFLFAAISILLSANMASAQDTEVSSRETFDFLGDYMMRYAGDAYTSYQTYEGTDRRHEIYEQEQHYKNWDTSANDPCFLKFTSVFKRISSDDGDTIYDEVTNLEISMSSVDPDAITFKARYDTGREIRMSSSPFYRVTLNSSAGNKAMRFVDIKSAYTKDSGFRDSQTITFMDEERALRAQKAFIHLATKCNASDSLFKL